jgi:hypothetical protein
MANAVTPGCDIPDLPETAAGLFGRDLTWKGLNFAFMRPNGRTRPLGDFDVRDLYKAVRAKTKKAAAAAVHKAKSPLRKDIESVTTPFIVPFYFYLLVAEALQTGRTHGTFLCIALMLVIVAMFDTTTDVLQDQHFHPRGH